MSNIHTPTDAKWVIIDSRCGDTVSFANTYTGAVEMMKAHAKANPNNPFLELYRLHATAKICNGKLKWID